MRKFTLMNLEGRHITRVMLSNMTEKTQEQMFGKVLQKRYDHSIHSYGRRPRMTGPSFSLNK